jgi:Glycosyl hydrolases family 16
VHRRSQLQHVRRPRQTWLRTSVITGALAVLCMSTVATGNAHASASGSSPTALARAVRSRTPYPMGVFDFKEPSYFAPPGPSAMPGYTRAYVDDFTQQLSSADWYYFRGVPQGDPSGRFDPRHVVVAHGLLKIGTWRDPRFNQQWVSGGVGLYSLPTLYGAYFIRSRETQPGPDTSELLWPQNNQWPPEIDIDEGGASPNTQSWFVHFDNSQDQVFGTRTINIEHWHTWGVIWTPTSITFTVDGQEWGEVTTPSQIPTIPMELDLQSQSWCGISGQACPTQDSVLLVDWVSVYTPT